MPCFTAEHVTDSGAVNECNYEATLTAAAALPKRIFPCPRPPLWDEATSAVGPNEGQRSGMPVLLPAPEP